MDSNELREALERAGRLIDWMSAYIGKMAPGSYRNCYSDLNEHGCFMSKMRDGADTHISAPNNNNALATTSAPVGADLAEQAS